MAHPIYPNKNGVVVPSVTRVIRGNLGWSTEPLLNWYYSSFKRGVDPIQVRDKAGYFGTLLHAMLERGRKNPKLDADVKAHVTEADRQEAFRIMGKYKEWTKLKNLEVVGHEMSLVSEEYQFGGTIDLLAHIQGEDDKITLIDFKTSKSVKVEHFIQMAAYGQLVKEHFSFVPSRYLLLHMPRGCKYPTAYTRDTLAAEWGVFKHLLDLERAKETLSWQT